MIGLYRNCTRWTIVLLALQFFAHSASGQVEFVSLGPIPNGTGSFGKGVSSDGNTVAGFDTVSGVGDVGFLWKRGVGFTQFFTVSDSSTRMYDVSGDGLRSVGAVSANGTGGTSAFCWDAITGSTGLPTVGQGGSYAVRVSRDGTTAVGQSGGRAAMWNSTGAGSLGSLPGGDLQSDARAVSANGTVITGQATTAAGSVAFRWTAAQGMQSLDTLPGYTASAAATGVSADGATIVGLVSSNTHSQAFRWTAAGGIIGLGVLRPENPHSGAEAVSADGRVIVGESNGSSFSEAFLWTADMGMVSLLAFLTDHGADNLAGWSILTADAISPDGRFIVGTAVDPELHLRAYVATIPSPACAALSVMTIGCMARRKRRV